LILILILLITIFFCFGLGFSLLVFHTPKEKPNKMLKCLFFPTNVIPTYFSKEPKIIKWGRQKNKPIKSSHVKKKNNIKIIKKK